jgi:hypothetical protein
MPSGIAHYLHIICRVNYDKNGQSERTIRIKSEVKGSWSHYSVLFLVLNNCKDRASLSWSYNGNCFVYRY